jgi:hypothetical protein
MIIDGVLDVNSYYGGQYHCIQDDSRSFSPGDWRDELSDTDKELRLFFDSCLKAGSTICPFAASGSTSDDLMKALNALLDKVRAQPVPVYDKATQTYGVVDYATLKYAIEQSLYTPYDPTSFLGMGTGLVELKNGNGSSVYQKALASQEQTTCSSISTGNVLEGEIAVSCGDMAVIPDGPAELEQYFQDIANISIFTDFLVPRRIHCS